MQLVLWGLAHTKDNLKIMVSGFLVNTWVKMVVKNTFSGKCYTFLKEQEISLFLVYRTCIFISILFSSASFAGVSTVYESLSLRQFSYKSDAYTFPILTNINHYQLAKAGFLCLGCIVVQCFCCDKKIEPHMDMALGDLKTKCHNDGCDYIDSITHEDLCSQEIAISSMDVEEVNTKISNMQIGKQCSGAIERSNYLNDILPSFEGQPSAPSIFTPVLENSMARRDTYELCGAEDDVEDGTSSVTSVQNSNGDLNLNFGVSYGAVAASSSIELSVSAVNDALIISGPLSATVDEDNKLIIEQEGLVANECDIDGDTLIASNVQVNVINATVVANEDAVYLDALHRLYMTTSTLDTEQQQIWEGFHSRLTKHDVYQLGLSFDMKDAGSLFPVIRRDVRYCYRFCDAQELKECFLNCDRFLALSLMLEMDRKLALEVKVSDSSSYAELLHSFKKTHLSYLVSKSGKMVLGGCDKEIQDVISNTGKIISGVDVVDNDIGALLLVAPRFLLLESKATIAELSNLVYNLSKMFCEQTLLYKIYSCLKIQGHRTLFSVILAKMTLMPSDKEIAFLISQHVSSIYLWSLLERIKNNNSVPEFVCPNSVEQYYSVENMKRIIWESAMSVFSGKKKLKMKIKNLARVVGEECRIVGIDSKLEECFKCFKENFAAYYLLELTDKDSFKMLFPGGEFRSVCVQTKKELVEYDYCNICTKRLEVDKTKMIGLTSCNHFIDARFGGNCLELCGARCPLCRKDFKDPFAYIYSGEGAEIQRLNEIVELPVDKEAENSNRDDDSTCSTSCCSIL
ncbi:MAG: cadherin-like domain-containing protein [Candidatus Endonucleobacter bathymodioli]|uniref:Cadherin-like domain-containing protein n=1 Tax=Candidatus Endonucleibacter bathymodioli TaxID=539814 RepID=A0AA90NN93_9GAMM|nr:cadherin-like domain-containing protein [Candidatus Endonucleobacter bathymodioli]